MTEDVSHVLEDVSFEQQKVLHMAREESSTEYAGQDINIPAQATITLPVSDDDLATSCDFSVFLFLCV